MATIDDFGKLDIRVAQVVEVRDHPNADKLLLLEIDLGTERRQIVAGLRPYYRREELLGKKIVVVANLESVKLRGEESRGMLLAAQDGSAVVILAPERDMAVGSRVR
ncbi:MAG: methionine--tRNA ligase subunit beta [Planctomycetota bacterium]